MCPRLLTVTCLLCVQVGLSAINILDKRSWGQKGVVLKYFDTGKYAARGGILRLWLRETGIPFSEETVPHDEWPALKAELKGTWENPTGELPMMTYQGKSFYGTNAIGRYLSRKVKARHFFTSYGQNAEDDFWVDVALEETHSMHNDWAKSLAGSNVRLFPRKTGFFGKVKRAVVGEGPGPAARRARIQYLKRDRKEHYEVLEKLLKSRLQPFIGGFNLSFADVAIFSTVYDDTLVHGPMVQEYPKLKKHYLHIGNLPSVKSWIKEKGGDFALSAVSKK